MTRTEFDDLVRKLGRRLYGIAYRMLKNQEGSEDAVQEVMVKLWKMNARLSGYESVEALATTMTKNHCIDIIRKQKHFVNSDQGPLSFFSNNEPSPHEKLESTESFLAIRNIIDRLPGPYRNVIYQRDIEEKGYDDIAESTGQNINTLRVNLSRARKMVRDEYKKLYDETERNKTTA
ncbi:MAG TPA: sigma-70 family RNA polymerase sigma factor [Bacteroidales bacterium]|nr:sigma-70 family RNA polymerase sigma factor [Bacteroidales bacterium]